MYVKSDKRLIVDHDLVTINVIVVSGEIELDLYQELKFSHGYLHELEKDIMVKVKDRLPSIVDKYATNKISLDKSEITAIKTLLCIPDISADSFLLIHVVDVLSFDKMWNMSESEKVQVSSLLKTRGNYKARLNNWSDAFKNYHMASKYLKGSYSVTEVKHELHETARRLLIDNMNNVALSCLKLSSGYSLCIKYCKYVLDLEPSNTKALFRKAKALTHSGEWQKALLCTEECLRFEEDQKSIGEISQLRLLCQKHCKEQKKEERLLCKDILGKMEDIAIKRPESLDRVIPYEIDPWDNSMADEMLSIQQELEAFGEQMPPRCTINEFISTIDEED